MKGVEWEEMGEDEEEVNEVEPKWLRLTRVDVY